MEPAHSVRMQSALQRLVLEAAHRDAPGLPADALATLVSATWMDALVKLSPEAAWSFLAALLMAPYPAHGFEALRACGALKRWLPEVQALFGVPQLSDAAAPVDVGEHQIRFVQVTANEGAPLPVRFAALVHKVGKAGSPREIWPSHYKHEARAHAVLDAWAGQRFAIPAEGLALARLAIDEVERIHRVSNVRAGPIASMLQRLEATRQPVRFEQLLQLCACDWAAYAGHRVDEYPKAARLRRALAASQAVPVPVAGLDDEAAWQARAEAIAVALGSLSSLS